VCVCVCARARMLLQWGADRARADESP
jgi:hypothetical protein